MTRTFQSTPSAWRETQCYFRFLEVLKIFQSTPSAWRETTSSYASGIRCAFQSTPSAWRETDRICKPCGKIGTFQSTPSAWRETCTVSDIGIPTSTFQSTPSAWRETVPWHSATLLVIFQSTPSAWRETDLPCHRSLHPTHFNPLPPHGGRPLSDSFVMQDRVISIHSLRMEGDLVLFHFLYLAFSFQSTPSAWRETIMTCFSPPIYRIFQSTPSAWRETLHSVFHLLVCSISIHSLRMEGDRFRKRTGPERLYFNPLPPHGGRRGEKMDIGEFLQNFNPLPPHGGRRSVCRSLEYLP